MTERADVGDDVHMAQAQVRPSLCQPGQGCGDAGQLGADLGGCSGVTACLQLCQCGGVPLAFLV